MKVTSKEVRTIYSIKVSATDFYEVKVAWFADEVLRISYPKAFSFCASETAALENQCLEKTIREMQELSASGDRARLIAKHFGFDGFENAGYFNKRTRTLDMVVYNHGDDM